MCAIHVNGMSEVGSTGQRVCVGGTDDTDLPAVVHFDNNRYVYLVRVHESSNEHIFVILLFHSTESCLKSRSLPSVQSVLYDVLYKVHCSTLNIVDLQQKKCWQIDPFCLLDVPKMNTSVNSIKATEYMQGHWTIEKGHTSFLFTHPNLSSHSGCFQTVHSCTDVGAVSLFKGHNKTPQSHCRVLCEEISFAILNVSEI